jgi:hypothetical protein
VIGREIEERLQWSWTVGADGCLEVVTWIVPPSVSPLLPQQGTTCILRISLVFPELKRTLRTRPFHPVATLPPTSHFCDIVYSWHSSSHCDGIFHIRYDLDDFLAYAAGDDNRTIGSPGGEPPILQELFHAKRVDAMASSKQFTAEPVYRLRGQQADQSLLKLLDPDLKSTSVKSSF